MATNLETNRFTSESLSVSEARQCLTQLPEKLQQEELGALAVTRRGKPVMAIMSWELFESIIETLEVLGDEELMAALHKSIQAIQDGKTFTSQQAREKLGL